jgi:hypothetical protein
MILAFQLAVEVRMTVCLTRKQVEATLLLPNRTADVRRLIVAAHASLIRRIANRRLNYCEISCRASDNNLERVEVQQESPSKGSVMNKSTDNERKFRWQSRAHEIRSRRQEKGTKVE